MLSSEQIDVDITIFGKTLGVRHGHAQVKWFEDRFKEMELLRLHKRLGITYENWFASKARLFNNESAPTELGSDE